MSNRFSLIVFACLAALPGAHARLGESLESMIDRLGVPAGSSVHLATDEESGQTFPLGSRLTFWRGEWSIACDIINGRCLRSFYSLWVLYRGACPRP